MDFNEKTPLIKIVALTRTEIICAPRCLIFFFCLICHAIWNNLYSFIISSNSIGAQKKKNEFLMFLHQVIDSRKQHKSSLTGHRLMLWWLQQIRVFNVKHIYFKMTLKVLDIFFNCLRNIFFFLNCFSNNSIIMHVPLSNNKLSS